MKMGYPWYPQNLISYWGGYLAGIAYHFWDKFSSQCWFDLVYMWLHIIYHQKNDFMLHPNDPYEIAGEQNIFFTSYQPQKSNKKSHHITQ